MTNRAVLFDVRVVFSMVAIPEQADIVRLAGHRKNKHHDRKVSSSNCVVHWPYLRDLWIPLAKCRCSILDFRAGQDYCAHG